MFSDANANLAELTLLQGADAIIFHKTIKDN